MLVKLTSAAKETPITFRSVRALLPTTRCQFHQRFSRAFFVRTMFWQLFTSYVWLGAKISFEKKQVKNVDEIDGSRQTRIWDKPFTTDLTQTFTSEQRTFGQVGRHPQLGKEVVWQHGFGWGEHWNVLQVKINVEYAGSKFTKLHTTAITWVNNCSKWC